MSIPIKKVRSSGSPDPELASLVSSIKKNVSASSSTSSAPVPKSTSESHKKRHDKPIKKDKKPVLDSPTSKKHSEQSRNASASALDSDDIIPPKQRKRSREQITGKPETDNDTWDDEFEKDDIEDMFDQLKSSKSARREAEKRSKEEHEALERLLKRAAEQSGNTSASLRSKNEHRDPNRRYTEDGLPIYTAAELGLNDKGGDTPLCPFDCDCCF